MLIFLTIGKFYQLQYFYQVGYKQSKFNDRPSFVRSLRLRLTRNLPICRALCRFFIGPYAAHNDTSLHIDVLWNYIYQAPCFFFKIVLSLKEEIIFCVDLEQK
jgi:hypothetical protein